MDCCTPHQLLFNKLACCGYPKIYNKCKILYDFEANEVDLDGFSERTVEKIIKMKELLDV